MPVPIGTVAPTITFSVTPLRDSICPSKEAFAIVGTVISNVMIVSEDHAQNN